MVSANYRLGALGFLDARSFGGVANCGLRDAICRARVGARPHRYLRRRADAGHRVRRVGRRRADPARARVAHRARTSDGGHRAERRDVRDPRRGTRRAPSSRRWSTPRGRATGRTARPSADALVAAQGAAMGAAARDGRDDAVPSDGRRRGPARAARRRVRVAAPRPASRSSRARPPTRCACSSTRGRARAPRKIVRRAARYLGVDEARRGADRRALRARARHRRHARDLARAVRRQRDAGAVPRGARRARCRTARRTRTASRGGARRSVRATASTSRSRSATSSTAGTRSSDSTTTGTRCSARSATHGPRSRAPATPVGRSTHGTHVRPDGCTTRAAHPLFARLANSSLNRARTTTVRRPAEHTFDGVGRLRERAARDGLEEVHRRIGEPRIEPGRDDRRAPLVERAVDALHAEAGRDLVAVERVGTGEAQRAGEVVADERDRRHGRYVRRDRSTRCVPSRTAARGCPTVRHHPACRSRW